MTTAEVALQLVKAYIDKAPQNALVAGMPSDYNGQQVAETAGNNIGVLYDTVYKAVTKSFSATE